MRVRAVCAARFRGAVSDSTGVEPLLSPPVTVETFDPDCLAAFDVVYFDLHGEPGKGVWYGQKEKGGALVPAVTAEQLRMADLREAVVYAVNCYVGDEESPMLEALLEAGARYVVAGKGRNWGPEDSSRYGASALGKWFLFFLRVYDPPKALGMAKRVLRLGVRKKGLVMAQEDTLAFEIFENTNGITNEMAGLMTRISNEVGGV